MSVELTTQNPVTNLRALVACILDSFLRFQFKHCSLVFISRPTSFISRPTFILDFSLVQVIVLISRIEISSRHRSLLCDRKAIYPLKTWAFKDYVHS